MNGGKPAGAALRTPTQSPARKKQKPRSPRHRIPDIVSIDQNGARSVVDCMVTTVASKIKTERAAARAGEDTKWKKYEDFLRRCKAEDPGDPGREEAF